MMNFLRLKVLLFLLLLSSYAHARVGVGTRLAQAGKTLHSKIAKAVPAAVLMAGLSVLPSAYAQQDDAMMQNDEMMQEDNAWLTVDADSPAYQRSVFNFYIESVHVDDEGKVEEVAMLFPMGYLGTDNMNRAVFVGRNGVGPWIVTELAARGNTSLVSYEGLVAENVMVERLGMLPDKLDTVLSMVVVAVSGVDLEGDYEPLMIGSYPYMDEMTLELVSYHRQVYLPAVQEKELEEWGIAEKIPLRVRECQSVPNMRMSNAGLGLHTCDGAGKDGIAHGAFLFLNGELVALQSRPLEEGVAMAVEINQNLRQYARNLYRGGAYDVDARGKATTTWGAIKANSR